MDVALNGVGIDGDKFSEMVFEGRVLIQDKTGEYYDMDFAAARTEVQWPASVLIWVDEEEIKVNGTKVESVQSPASPLCLAPSLAILALLASTLSLHRQK